MRRVTSRALLATAVLIGAIVACHAAEITPHVSICGPQGDAWVNQDLLYTAYNCYYDLDAETQAAVESQEASVSTQFSWSYQPATLVSGGGNTDGATVRYAHADGGTTRTVSVTYTVTVTWSDNTQESNWDTAECPVDIKRPTLSELVVEGDSTICVGTQSRFNETTITATVTDGFGNGAGGFDVTLEVTSTPGVHQGAVLDHTQAQTTDQWGHVYATLTSGDQVGTVTVKATTPWGDEETVEVEVVGPDATANPDGDVPVGLGGTVQLEETLTWGSFHGVHGHTIEWVVTAVEDEDGNVVGEQGWGDYGGVTASGPTNEWGSTTGTYQSGSKAGTLTVEARDTDWHEPDGQHKVLHTLTLYVFAVRFVEGLCHDYIVPGSPLNTVTYRILPSGFTPDSVEMEVKDVSNYVLRTVANLPTGPDPVTGQWDGLDGDGYPISQISGAFTYRLRAWAGEQQATADLSDRKIRPRTITIIIPDRSSPDSVYESGVDEETVADYQGDPINFHVKVRPTGASDWTEIPYFVVTPNTGEKGWDADVELGSWYGDRYQFYSAPTHKEGLPDIGYTVVMWETDPFVADFAGNPWDMDPDAEEQQTQGTWTFSIGPDGELVGFAEAYE